MKNARAQRIVSFGVMILFVALGAVQGARLDDMRETESFYRWVVTAASLIGFGDTLEPDKSPNLPEAMDDELFAEIVALAETVLPDLPVEEDDLDEAGNAKPVLLRAVRQKADRQVYDMLARGDGRRLREDFMNYVRIGKLQSAGTQFSTAALYDQTNQVEGVGLTSLFFGFRKLAANFIWMQVDKYWHKGEMHRMVPLMRTCVTLDPNFVDAYLLGSWHLAYNLTAKLLNTPEPQKVYHPKYRKRLGYKEEWYYVAADFLKDGIKKNPRDYRLYFDLGYSIYETKLKDHPNAVLYLNEARRYKHDQWVPRMLYGAMWRNGQYEDAIAGWKDYLKTFPDSYQARRFLPINEGFLHEARAEQAVECRDAAREARRRYQALATQARESGRVEEASEYASKAEIALGDSESLEEMAQSERNAARLIWVAMIRDNEDSVAMARLQRQNALAFAAQGRYIEAVAELQLARYEMLEAFDEFSDLMIKLKQQGGLDLTVSERLAVEREREAAEYDIEDNTPHWRYIDCAYLDGDEAETASSDPVD